MIGVSWKRQRFLWVTILLLVAPGSILLHPRARAALRLVGGFDPLPLDGRIYFEAGAESQAKQLARALPEAVAAVERVHGLPFESSFRVYFCGSHESFTRRLRLPNRSTVRGVAFTRDVWLSPMVFDFHGRNTHAESIGHELSHLHFRQHLGWIRQARNVPTWFAEGLADLASGTGFEIVSRARGLAALRAGHRFEPDGQGHLPLPKPIFEYGLSPPMLHAQSRLFVEYLATAQPNAFSRFVPALLTGEPFESAFQEAFDRTLAESWRLFLSQLQSERSGPATGR